MSTDDILSRLGRLHPKVIDLSLGRVQRLLDAVGHPETRLPKVIHVAGTNGKGSVVAFLRAFLEAHGLRVHVLTSPHLVRFHERIVVAGTEIDDAALAAVLEECERINDGQAITFFEITTVAALLAFARTPADVTLLETGLGGRLDATNVVDRPALTVLTPIALDHQAFLGDTLAAIAAEKAGILKPGVPCLSAAQSADADTVVRATAEALGAPLYVEGRDWSAASRGDALVYRDPGVSLMLPKPPLAGGFQIGNAGLAIATMTRVPGLHLAESALRRGMGRVSWPGRLQRLDDGPLNALLPKDWELWIDGGHNPAAGEAIAREIRNWRDRRLHIVFGMLRQKDALGFLGAIAPWCTGEAAAIAIPGEANSLTAEEGAAAARHAGLACAPAAGLDAALSSFGQGDTEPARVLICGSLYLAGSVLAAHRGIHNTD